MKPLPDSPEPASSAAAAAVPAAAAVAAAASQRLLLVKLGAIGDVAMLIPAAFEMHRAGFAVDWVCSTAVVPLLRLYPWINLIAVDERALLHGTRGERARTILALWRTLRGRRYDLCATLYYDRRYRILALPVRAARRLHLSPSERAFRLIPGRHHTNEYARILMSRPDGETPYQLPPVLIRGLPPGLLPPSPLPPSVGRRRIVLLPGGARNLLRDDALRRWPIECHVELAAALLADGHEVILAGGPDDRWASAAFASLGMPDLIGQLSLIETVALLDSADVTISHDTGPLHLAGLTRSAVLGLFGPTDPHMFLPQRSGCVALWGGDGFACRPCYDGRGYPPCQHNGCIRQITPAMVLGEVDSLLAALDSGAALPPPRIVTPPHASVFSLVPLTPHAGEPRQPAEQSR